jgi:hypothetical protein
VGQTRLARIAGSVPYRRPAKQWFEIQRRDPAAWLRDPGVTPTDEHIEAASNQLRHQPATTVHATARSVIELTGRDDYEALLRGGFATTPVSRRVPDLNGYPPGWAVIHQAAPSPPMSRRRGVRP